MSISIHGLLPQAQPPTKPTQIAESFSVPWIQQERLLVCLHSFLVTAKFTEADTQVKPGVGIDAAFRRHLLELHQSALVIPLVDVGQAFGDGLSRGPWR
jgi:hypothetical protein